MTIKKRITIKKRRTIMKETIENSRKRKVPKKTKQQRIQSKRINPEMVPVRMPKIEFDVEDELYEMDVQAALFF